ncbi:MAG: IclR family transcriptional regulator [Acidobacteriia bacterium]|nr:IclR family transcriptional regulator [Terriglobia bacterium]
MRGAAEQASSAVDRALGMLEAISERSGGMTNAELSRKLRIPKSSASYILRVLEQRGYLRRERTTGKYRLGLKVVSLSRGVLGGLDIRELAIPALHHLVEHVHLTAHLAILDGGKAVYIEKVEAPGFIKMDTWVGRRMEVHTTSVGKAILAHLPKSEAEALLKGLELTRRTRKTITTLPQFSRELAHIRTRGFAVDDEENNLGVRCVAAPIFDALGDTVASVGVSGTTSQVDRSSMSKIADLVKDAARRISHQLGHQSAARKGHAG